ncbi:MAG TPA: DoxX family protein [Casimicrobiaceae bacterium]|nr:DoxX family protein [Casimicrobiaceae bacterium]
MDKSGFLALWSDRLLSVLRIVVSGLYIQHGTAKLFHVPHIAQFDGVQLISMIGVAGVLEIVFGVLVLIGLFTRFSAFILSGEMAFGYFIAHAPKAFLPILNGGELAAIYCWTFLYFAAAGGGPWSLDACLRRVPGDRALRGPA